MVAGPDQPHFERASVLPVGGTGYGYTETYVAQAYEFIRAVVGERPSFEPSFEDGYAVALVCEAVQLAAEQHRSVRLDEMKPAFTNGA